MQGLKIFNLLNKSIGYRQKTAKFNPYGFKCRRLKTTQQDVMLNEEQKLQNMIIYNEVLWKYKKKKLLITVKSEVNTNKKPICLEYLGENENEAKEHQTKELEEGEKLEKFNLSYCATEKHLTKASSKSSINDVFPRDIINFTPMDNVKTTLPNEWSGDLIVDAESNLINDNIGNVIWFGTADPRAPVSSVPCGGCGALLQCNDAGLPGFLPKEVFQSTSRRKLRSQICQRCHFVEEFGVALGVNVSPEEYPRILSQIKNKKALVILMIDLLDFPCSFWPDLSKVIGTNDVIVVGNKIDLFIQEDKLFESNIKDSLRDALEEAGLNLELVLDIQLLSAKTGFGVERLVTSIIRNWNNEGDIYLLGCTNVGKSTLFNLLIKSDICRIEADGVLKRATVSFWPGTTLNVLKFPMKKLYGSLLYYRGKRCQQESIKRNKNEMLHNEKYPSVFKQRTLREPVSRTTVEDVDPRMEEFTSVTPREEITGTGLDPKDHRFTFCRWFYDTPGVVQTDQIINLLTTSELVLTLPNELIKPRVFNLSPGKSLFVGGLARVDFVQGSESAWFTVFASKKLPITITTVENAETVYNKLLGSNLFCVPTGDTERLSKWPEMKSKKIEICGRIVDEAAGDVVLSSAGWISVTLEPAFYCKLTVWTPGGKGIYLRQVPVIKKSHQFKGEKIKGTPAHKIVVEEVKDGEYKAAVNRKTKKKKAWEVYD